MMVMETLEGAKKRGARIYAEVKGYGLSSDGFQVTAPDPQGDGPMRAMRLALRSAQLSPDQIDYVNAHGTGTPVNDKMEALALQAIFGERVIPPTVNYHTPDPECSLDCVPNIPRPVKIRSAMNNSFAFGGNNAVVIFAAV